MPRLAGVDIPNNKKISISLRYLYGIGPKFADDVLKEANIEPEKKASDLTEDELGRISTVLDNSYLTEGALRRKVANDITRLREIQCYRGGRHRRGLPVRGQSTQSNARTRKGKKKTVAGKKGVKG
ncbi:MAG: 30S ribosomal protein S13 [Planctomycetota bacterium]